MGSPYIILSRFRTNIFQERISNILIQTPKSKHMKKASATLALISCFLLLSAASLCQPSMQRVFLVTNDGDTLHGWIKYMGWERVPRSVDFGPDSLAKHLVTYEVADLRYMAIAGAEAYERAVVSKDSLPSDTVFLRLLIKGQKLSLYKLSSEQFFVRVKDGDYEQATALALKTYAEKFDLSSLFPQIDAAGIDENALVKIVLALNGNAGSSTFTKPVIANKLHWFFGVGALVSTMSISGDKSYLGQIDFNNTAVSPYLLLGLDYLFSSGIGPWGIRLEASYFSATYKASGVSTGTSLDHINYALEQRNLSSSGYLLYHFINRHQIRVYAAAGVGANFSTYPQNTYQESFPSSTTTYNYATMNGFWLSANLKVGVILTHRLELGAATILGNYSKELAYSFDPRTTVFWAGYRF